VESIWHIGFAVPDWLEIFETDVRDPLDTYTRATSPMPPASELQPELSRSFRLANAHKASAA
jgi:hypothetical protein